MLNCIKQWQYLMSYHIVWIKQPCTKPICVRNSIYNRLQVFAQNASSFVEKIQNNQGSNPLHEACIRIFFFFLKTGLAQNIKYWNFPQLYICSLCILRLENGMKVNTKLDTQTPAKIVPWNTGGNNITATCQCRF